MPDQLETTQYDEDAVKQYRNSDDPDATCRPLQDGQGEGILRTRRRDLPAADVYDKGVDGKPALQVGAAPCQAKLPDVTGGVFTTNQTDLSDKSVLALSSGRMRTSTARNSIRNSPQINGRRRRASGQLGINPIDASIAVSAGGINTYTGKMPDFRDESRWYKPLSAEEKTQLENQLPGQGAAGDVDNRMRLTGEPDTAPGTRGTLVTPTLCTSTPIAESGQGALAQATR